MRRQMNESTCRSQISDSEWRAAASAEMPRRRTSSSDKLTPLSLGPLPRLYREILRTRAARRGLLAPVGEQDLVARAQPEPETDHSLEGEAAPSAADFRRI